MVEARTLAEAKHKLEQLSREISKTHSSHLDFKKAFELSLLETIRSTGDTVCGLVEAGKIHDAKILLRVMLEHLVELKLLRKEPARHLNHALKLSKSIRTKLKQADGGNPFLDKIAQCLDVDSALKNTKEQIDDYTKEGASLTTAIADWTKAEMKDEYESIYRGLSQLVHPSYTGAFERNIDSDTANDAFVVTNTKPIPEVSLNIVTDTLSGVLDEAIEIVPDYQ